MEEFKVSEIIIYPVKSLGGISLKSSIVSSKGLANDRRWMLIDENDNFLTQRVFPQMAFFKTEIYEDKFRLIHKGDKLELKPGMFEGPPINATIWDDKVEVYEVNRSHSKWFSERMGFSCRLVYFPETSKRNVDPNFAHQEEQVGLADDFPLLLIGQSSLDDLNSRMKDPLPMERFRPNIVFTGGDPFEEDNWKYISIGKSNFHVAKPCARCVLTTVDQQTGKKGKEPLATLSTYRGKNNKILFGQNLLIVEGNEINLGDPILQITR